ncbi:transposase [Oceanobacter sp. 3_MG-2023]|uniref:transposase n=1 Tax=Oceanobacter sp. 3_MG-2023 TaxID=3062622 RepID=UPI00351EFCA6
MSKLERHCQSSYCSNNGRPGSSSRLIIGLTLLKHIYALSDEHCIARWVEPPYWQHFCGEQYFQHRPPIDPNVRAFDRGYRGAQHDSCITGLHQSLKERRRWLIQRLLTRL